MLKNYSAQLFRELAFIKNKTMYLGPKLNKKLSATEGREV